MERQIKVGDTVRIKDNAAEYGWLKPGEISKVGSVTGDALFFYNSGGDTSLYYVWEVVLSTEVLPYQVVRDDDLVAAFKDKAHADAFAETLRVPTNVEVRSA